MMTFVTIATYAPMVAMIPFSELVIKKIGKKEICVYGLILSVAATLVMTVWRIPNPWIFIAFCFLQGAGVSFFTLEIWALAMDVIDSHELMTGRREEAIGYAAFTFMRKIGQAIAAVVPLLLAAVGYVAGKGYGGQSPETVDGIYLIATVVPLVMFALMLVLMLLYPLNKRRDAEMREKLAALRAEREEEQDPDEEKRKRRFCFRGRRRNYETSQSGLRLCRPASVGVRRLQRRRTRTHARNRRAFRGVRRRDECGVGTPRVRAVPRLAADGQVHHVDGDGHQRNTDEPPSQVFCPRPERSGLRLLLHRQMAPLCGAAGTPLRPENSFVPPGPDRLGFDGYFAAYNFHHRYYAPYAYYHLDTPEKIYVEGYEPDL